MQRMTTPSADPLSRIGAFLSNLAHPALALMGQPQGAGQLASQGVQAAAQGVQPGIIGGSAVNDALAMNDRNAKLRMLAGALQGGAVGGVAGQVANNLPRQ